MQPKVPGAGGDTNAGIRAVCLDGAGNTGMRMDDGRIAAYHLRLNPEPVQAEIQPLAHAGARFPVHKKDVLTDQVLQRLDTQRISGFTINPSSRR